MYVFTCPKIQKDISFALICLTPFQFRLSVWSIWPNVVATGSVRCGDNSNRGDQQLVEPNAKPLSLRPTNKHSDGH